MSAVVILLARPRERDLIAIGRERRATRSAPGNAVSGTTRSGGASVSRRMPSAAKPSLPTSDDDANECRRLRHRLTMTRGRHRGCGAGFRVLLDLLQRDLHVGHVLEAPLRVFPQAAQDDFFADRSGMPATIAVGGFGCARRTALSVSAVDVPANARTPVTISYSIAPKLKMSLRASTFAAGGLLR